MNDSSEEFVDPLSDYEPAVYSSEIERILAEESVSAIQIRPFAQIEPTATVRQAVAMLHELKVACLLVIDGGEIVGIFTERDVLERVAEQYSRVAEKPVAAVMTTEPLITYSDDPAASALAANASTPNASAAPAGAAAAF